MVKYEKLSRDKEEKTVIMAGHVPLTVEQLENEMKSTSDMGRKLKEIEKKLEKY